jgi:hypothetical protein
LPATEERLYIGDVAAQLDRVPHTIRMWEQRTNFLPKRLIPHRDERGWRYWTPDQVDGIKKWLIDEDIRPGRAFGPRRTP